MAGSLAREGRYADLYDLDVVRDREHAVAQESGLAVADGVVGPGWNPPVYAWAFAPLAQLSFGNALAVWTAINLAAMAGALVLLCRLAPGHPGLVVTLVLCSAPFVSALTHGQNTPISLLLVAAVAHAWRGRRDVLAGALAGFLMYKPQLAAALAAVLVLHRGRRAAGGLAAVGLVLLLATVVTMPGALSDYVSRMPLNLHVMQVEHAYLWERHVTFKAFWRLLLQGRGAGETSTWASALAWAAALPFAAGLFLSAWRARRANGAPNDVIAAIVAAAPLLMPFYFDYDLLLLAVPAVLVGTQPMRASRATVGCWVALYLLLFVNPYVAPKLRVNLAVPPLACLAGGAVVRALRRRETASGDPGVIPAPARPRLAPSRKAA